MTIKNLLEACLKLLKDSPQKDKKQLAIELKKVYNWCYPGTDTQDLVYITRCKDCSYYKRFRKKGTVNKAVKYLCSFDKTERKPDFYCGNASRKEQV